ncbi:MAG: hypothetical protein AAF492_18350, partial [Verrucomicrobiota bacterium]
GAFGTGDGSFAALMDSTSGTALNELQLAVNLGGFTRVDLRYQHASYGDELTVFGAPFTGHFNADGIAMSPDGVNWYPLWSPAFQPNGTWLDFSTNLTAAATAAGISLGPNFQLRFQQFDNSQLTSDGRGYDSIQLTTPGGNEDWYSVSALAGQPLTVVGKALNAATNLSVDLFDAGMTLLAAGIATNNAEQVIQGFIPPIDGTYYARVSGNEIDYNLVVIRGGLFNLESNDDADVAQPIPDNILLIGHVESTNITPFAAGLDSLVNLPQNLNDGDNFLWDIQGNGNINNGTGDAYDGGMVLAGFPSQATAEEEAGGRELVIGPALVGGVMVTRKLYVPTDEGYIRYLDIVENTGNSPANFTVDIDTNLGSDGSTVTVGTSSGDTTFDVMDTWLVTDDADNGGDPTMLHVIGDGRGMMPSLANIPFTGGITYQWALTLAPGETQIIMHFASQNPNRATALPKGPEIVQLQRDVLNDISPLERSRIVNWDLGDNDDWYSFNAIAGEGIIIESVTPSDGPLAHNNRLDPLVELYGPTTNLLAANDNGAADGKNVALT